MNKLLRKLLSLFKCKKNKVEVLSVEAYNLPNLVDSEYSERTVDIKPI